MIRPLLADGRGRVPGTPHSWGSGIGHRVADRPRRHGRGDSPGTPTSARKRPSKVGFPPSALRALSSTLRDEVGNGAVPMVSWRAGEWAGRWGWRVGDVGREVSVSGAVPPQPAARSPQPVPSPIRLDADPTRSRPDSTRRRSRPRPRSDATLTRLAPSGPGPAQPGAHRVGEFLRAGEHAVFPAPQAALRPPKAEPARSVSTGEEQWRGRLPAPVVACCFGYRTRGIRAVVGMTDILEGPVTVPCSPLLKGCEQWRNRSPLSRRAEGISHEFRCLGIPSRLRLQGGHGSCGVQRRSRRRKYRQGGQAF